MQLDFFTLDFFTVLIAAIVFFIIGALWYSPALFAKQWMKALKLKSGQLKNDTVQAYVIGFIISFVQAYFLALLFSCLGIVSVADGMTIAFGIWLGFIATIKLSRLIWMRSPFQEFLIDAGYYLVGFLAMGAILGA